MNTVIRDKSEENTDNNAYTVRREKSLINTVKPLYNNNLT